jgi:NAD(P)-dependent dehydrogenase (short-subunit alcohol dehydrogenase family)
MVMERFDLTGKVVVVTGAARGLGKQMTLALAKAGADILGADLLTEQNEQTADEVRALGSRALAVKVDVRDSHQCDELIQRCLREFGHIDVMLSNAGIGEGRGLNQPLRDVTDDDWADTIAINLSSASVPRACTHDGPGPRRDHQPGSGTAARSADLPYAAGSSRHLTKSLAMLLARYNICVNCIIPGEFARRPSQSEEESFWPIGALAQRRRAGSWPLAALASTLELHDGPGIPVDGGFAGGRAPVVRLRRRHRPNPAKRRFPATPI